MDRRPKVSFGYGQKAVAMTEDSVKLNFGPKYLEIVRDNGQVVMNLSIQPEGYHQIVLAKPKQT